ncbi:MAG TPA: hypothetical protein VFH59_09290 [Frateuria sp.]|uniref:hypothetical protein n=1 Tax=Frateuria sp. TaxID=2211372 RepID=UPI002D7E62B1|nr:hypothetical protein [Frateuria sp.]HET6805618.1 hypothetical protein [Frateuria sp.]
MFPTHPKWALAAMLAFGSILSAGGARAAAPATAASAGNIASVWIIWPKDGQARPFETALKTHAAWRKQNGEGFAWSIYQPVVGEDLGFYVIRSEQHTWQQIDADETWEREHGAAEFDREAGRYVKRVEHYFNKADAEHSHWIQSRDYKYFGVYDFQTKPEGREGVEDAIAKVHAAVEAARWPYPYEIDTPIGGRGGLLIVEPMKSYADMAEPNPSLMSVLARSLGSKESAKETMDKFDRGIEKSTYTIYLYRPDLSTPSTGQ